MEYQEKNIHQVFFSAMIAYKNGVKAADIERIAPSVIKLLRHVGFEDITVDNFTCKIETDK